MGNFAFDPRYMKELDRDIVEFIRSDVERQSEDRFNELALREFELLYRASKPYREYCRGRNISPLTVACWDEIPAVSSFPFKRILSCSPSRSDIEEFYHRSGVVELERKRGPLFPDRDTRALITIANDLLAKKFLFPDIERIEMLMMVPSPLMAPGMVMASGLDHMRERFGTQESRFLISFRGLELKTLVRALKDAVKTCQPVALTGATFVIDYFLDACERERIRFELPEGSRIADSGGFMGRYTKCPKEEYFEKCRKIFGVKEYLCVNALWICESSTVYFDNTLKNDYSGVTEKRFKEVPPWARVVAVDARNFERVPKGTVGLLRLYDLTNLAMAFAVQTDKMGYETEYGFEVIGKWNRQVEAADIDRSPQHPGGASATRVMEFFMHRKLSKLRDICSRVR